MDRAAFLDRDGVIIRKAKEGDYITRWDEVHLLPGVIEGMLKLHHFGFRVIVVTNQRCVGKGLISIPELEGLHRRLTETLAQQGGIIDAIYYCPHEKTNPPCLCRKPAAGMLLDAAKDHRIDLAASWMIGDSVTDVEAGRAAGCRTSLLTDNLGSSTEADVVATSLLEAVDRIVCYAPEI